MTAHKQREARLLILVGCVFVVFTGVVAAWVLTGARAARKAEARRDLELLLDLRAKALEKYLQTMSSEVVLWSGQERVRTALVVFSRDWDALGNEAGPKLQRLYIDENPHPVGEKEELANAADGSGYSEDHARFHPLLRRFLEYQGYYDVFLIDVDGNLLYTVFKERDFGTNLLDGPWQDSGLARVFRASRQARDPNFVAFADFAPYGPSQGAPASFIASPVFDQGKAIGVLAFQVPDDGINGILQFTEGMGASGETYIVGRDLLMRSDSRFSTESTILRTRVETESVTRALAGETGVRVTPDYRGIRVLSAYAPLRFEGTTWAILAEMDEAEVRKRGLDLRRFAIHGLLIVASTGTVTVLVLLFLLARRQELTAWTEG